MNETKKKNGFTEGKRKDRPEDGSQATRVAILSIIVENVESTEELNNILHEYSRFVVGRMGIPYRERGIHIISLVLDAPQNEISTLSGRIGRLPGVSARAAYAKV